MDERLKREGTKSHKQRVEEYNKYLSNLSEHHDMYVSLRTYFENWKDVVANVLGFIGRVSDLDNTCWGGCWVYIYIFRHYRPCVLLVPKIFDFLDRTSEGQSNAVFVTGNL